MRINIFGLKVVMNKEKQKLKKLKRSINIASITVICLMMGIFFFNTKCEGPIGNDRNSSSELNSQSLNSLESGIFDGLKGGKTSCDETIKISDNEYYVYIYKAF